MRVKNPILLDAVERFVTECVSDGIDGAWVAHEAVHRAYLRWAVKQPEHSVQLVGLRPNALAHVMHRLKLNAKKHRRWVGRRRIYGWLGLWPAELGEDNVFDEWFTDARDGRYRFNYGQSSKSIS